MLSILLERKNEIGRSHRASRNRNSVRSFPGSKCLYCSNYGITELRESLAEDINRSHGTDYGTENVVIEPGGKPTINKFLLALMNPADEVLYPNPGYPIYESLIEFYGGRAAAYGFREGQSGFEMNLDEYEGKSRSLVSFHGMPERCVILYSFSKKFAMTGWRLGAVIGPVETIEAIARLNVNDESCSNHFIQYGALQGLNGNQDSSLRRPFIYFRISPRP